MLTESIDFPFDTAKERQLLTSASGGPVDISPSQAIPELPELLERLKPFRCAQLSHSRQGSGRPKTQLFTRSTLRWHDNPIDGMYIAIGGDVYDITCRQALFMFFNICLMHTNTLQSVHGLPSRRQNIADRLSRTGCDCGVFKISRSRSQSRLSRSRYFEVF